MAVSEFFKAFLARQNAKPVQPYQPRVLITANDYRRAGKQGPPAHLLPIAIETAPEVTADVVAEKAAS